MSPTGSIYKQLQHNAAQDLPSECIRLVFTALFPENLEDQWSYLTCMVADVSLQQNFFRRLSHTISQAFHHLGLTMITSHDIANRMEPEWGWLYLRIQTQRLIDFARPLILSRTRSTQIEADQIPQIAKLIINAIRTQLGDLDPSSIGQKLTQRIQRLVTTTLSERRHNPQMTIETLFYAFPRKSLALTGRSLDIVNSTIQAARFFPEPPLSVRAFDQKKSTTQKYLTQAAIVFMNYIEPIPHAEHIPRMFNDILDTMQTTYQNKRK